MKNLSDMQLHELRSAYPKYSWELTRYERAQQRALDAEIEMRLRDNMLVFNCLNTLYIDFTYMLAPLMSPEDWDIMVRDLTEQFYPGKDTDDPDIKTIQRPTHINGNYEWNSGAPRLDFTFDLKLPYEIMQEAPNASVYFSGDDPRLSVSWEVTRGPVVCYFNCTQPLAKEDETILRACGKLQEEFIPSSIQRYSTC